MSRAPFSTEVISSIPKFFRLAVPCAMMVCFEWWSYEVILLLSGLLPNPKVEASVLSNMFLNHLFALLHTLWVGGHCKEDIADEDECLVEAFLSKDAGPQHTLADLIVRKIKENDAMVSSDAQPLSKLDISAIDLYKGLLQKL